MGCSQKLYVSCAAPRTAHTVNGSRFTQQPKGIIHVLPDCEHCSPCSVALLRHTSWHVSCSRIRDDALEGTLPVVCKCTLRAHLIERCTLMQVFMQSGHITDAVQRALHVPFRPLERTTHAIPHSCLAAAASQDLNAGRRPLEISRFCGGCRQAVCTTIGSEAVCRLRGASRFCCTMILACARYARLYSVYPVCVHRQEGAEDMLCLPINPLTYASSPSGCNQVPINGSCGRLCLTITAQNSSTCCRAIVRHISHAFCGA